MLAAAVRQLPPPEKGAHPQFSAHVYCGQTAGWIKMALGTEVGLGPGHIVLDGDPAPLPKKRAELRPNFRPNSIAAKRLDGSYPTWYGGRPRPRRHCVTWGASSPLQKGHSPLIFGPVLWPNCCMHHVMICMRVCRKTGSV